MLKAAPAVARVAVRSTPPTVVAQPPRSWRRPGWPRSPRRCPAARRGRRARPRSPRPRSREHQSGPVARAEPDGEAPAVHRATDACQLTGVGADLQVQPARRLSAMCREHGDVVGEAVVDQGRGTIWQIRRRTDEPPTSRSTPRPPCAPGPRARPAAGVGRSRRAVVNRTIADPSGTVAGATRLSVRAPRGPSPVVGSRRAPSGPTSRGAGWPRVAYSRRAGVRVQQRDADRGCERAGHAPRERLDGLQRGQDPCAPPAAGRPGRPAAGS